MAQHLGAVHDPVVRDQLGHERALGVADVERQLVGEQLLALLGRLHRLLARPRGRDLLAQVDRLELGQALLDERERAGLGDRPHQHVGVRVAVPHHVRLGHERAERVAVDDRPLEAEREDQRLHVVGHLRHRPALGVAAVGAPVAAVIGGEQPPALVGQRLERREPDRAVQARPAVQQDQRAARAALVHVELDVADRDAHLASLRGTRVGRHAGRLVRMSRFQELLDRRAAECRLVPARALQSLDEAEAFVRERGLLTRVRDCYLPSLYEACHEEPYAPGRGGFGSWPRTKWWWAGALERPGIHMLKVHRGKNLLVTNEVAAALDPLCRAELARAEERDADAARLLRHLGAAGPSLLEDLQLELGLEPKRLRALRAQLEAAGALVGRQLVIYTDAGGHQHTSELARWDQVFPERPVAAGGLAELVVAGVRAAVVTPEQDVGAWFHRGWGAAADHVDALVDEARLERPEPGWIALAT